MLHEYLRKIISCLSMLCRTIKNDEEILKCAENKKREPKLPRNNAGFGKTGRCLIAFTSASPKAVSYEGN